MSDEVMTAPEEQALFQLSNGRYIMDEAQSRVMFQIKEAQPEHSHPISGTGYSWDESGMAELFSECYKNDTRYVITGKTEFDKGDYTGYSTQYIDLWITILTVVDTVF